MMLWNVHKGEEIRQFAYGRFVVSTTYDPHGQTAVSASTDGRLILWDLAIGEALCVFTGHTSAVNDIAFLPNIHHAISGSADSALVLWDMDSGEAPRTFEGHSGAVQQVTVSPNGTSALLASRDSTIILWHLEPRSLGDLVKWVRDNRHIREFTCEERKQYRIEPLCE